MWRGGRVGVGGWGVNGKGGQGKDGGRKGVAYKLKTIYPLPVTVTKKY